MLNSRSTWRHLGEGETGLPKGSATSNKRRTTYIVRPHTMKEPFVPTPCLGGVGPSLVPSLRPLASGSQSERAPLRSLSSRGHTLVLSSPKVSPLVPKIRSCDPVAKKHIVEYLCSSGEGWSLARSAAVRRLFDTGVEGLTRRGLNIIMNNNNNDDDNNDSNHKLLILIITNNELISNHTMV